MVLIAGLVIDSYCMYTPAVRSSVRATVYIEN